VSIEAIVEEDEFATWHLTIVEDDGNFTRVVKATRPQPLIEFASSIGIKVIRANIRGGKTYLGGRKF
jgi:uncharacterized iron-regulated protein